MIEKVLETQNGRIYYFVEGVSTDKPWIVFLHGLSSNHTTWDETLSLYKDAGFNLLTVELRGHGLSDKRRKRNLYRIGSMKQDVVEIIKKENLNKVIVVGYSYGGYIGLDLAINNPELVDKLVLISANHASPFLFHWYGFVNPIVRWTTNLIAWLMIWQTRKKYHYYNHADAQGYWQSTFSGMATMPLSINYWILAGVFKMDYRNEISRIKCPTLLITGAGDSFITEGEINDMHKKMINSKVIFIGEGHFVASRYQLDTAEAIINFLR